MNTDGPFNQPGTAAAPVEASMSADPPSDLLPPRASEVAPVAIEWLWPGRLALGKMTLLDGDPELGKSLLTLDLAARLSAGRAWPDGVPIPEPAATLVLGSEDAADAVLPRLHALGADPSRIFLQPPDLDPATVLTAPASCLDRFLDHSQARLLVLDPVTAFLPSAAAFTIDPVVRRTLGPLVALAARRRCAVLLVRHLAKAARGQTLYRGLGSIALAAACRTAWLLAPDPRRRERRILADIKNNLGPRQPSLAFEITTGPTGGPALTWLGPCDFSADLLVTTSPSPRTAALDFLLEMLADGPRPAGDLWNAALPRGLNRRTLQRAREDLAIRSERRHENGRTICYWLLPGQQLPRPPVANDEADAVDRWLDHLRTQYPTATPLDDL